MPAQLLGCFHAVVVVAVLVVGVDVRVAAISLVPEAAQVQDRAEVVGDKDEIPWAGPDHLWTDDLEQAMAAAAAKATEVGIEICW